MTTTAVYDDDTAESRPDVVSRFFCYFYVFFSSFNVEKKAKMNNSSEEDTSRTKA